MISAARTAYSIAAVSKLTGISCHALRAWERRYGVPRPHRTASGHRRYDAEQVQLVRSIVQLIQQGQPVGSVMEAIHAGRSLPVDAGELPLEPDGVLFRPLLELLLDGRIDLAQCCYDALAETLDPADLTTQILGPALTEIGERWFRGECAIHQERCASGFLVRKLQLLIDQAQRAHAPTSRLFLVGSVQGDRHEGGVLIVCLLLELAGCRVINLGVDLPIGEFQEAIRRWRPEALGVSFVLSRNVNKRFRELARIRDVPVFVGGRSILNYQSLARRHGLIPLPGDASTAISTLLSKLHHDCSTNPLCEECRSRSS